MLQDAISRGDDARALSNVDVFAVHLDPTANLAGRLICHRGFEIIMFSSNREDDGESNVCALYEVIWMLSPISRYGTVSDVVTNQPGFFGARQCKRSTLVRPVATLVGLL